MILLSADGAEAQVSWRRRLGTPHHLSVRWCARGASIGGEHCSPYRRHPSATSKLPCCRTIAAQAGIAIEQCSVVREGRNEPKKSPLRFVKAHGTGSLVQDTEARINWAAHCRHRATRSRTAQFVNNFQRRERGGRGANISTQKPSPQGAALKPVDLGDKKARGKSRATHMLKRAISKSWSSTATAPIRSSRTLLLHSREGSGERRPSMSTRSSRRAQYIGTNHGARARSRDTDQAGRNFDPAVASRCFQQADHAGASIGFSNGFYAATKAQREIGDWLRNLPCCRNSKNLGDRARSEIRDNGSGIPRSAGTRCSILLTTKSPAKETGLGCLSSASRTLSSSKTRVVDSR